MTNTRQISPSLQEFKCPVCGAVRISFFPLNHKHDGQWVPWLPTKTEQSEPVKRGPGRPRKQPEVE